MLLGPCDQRVSADVTACLLSTDPDESSISHVWHGLGGVHRLPACCVCSKPRQARALGETNLNDGYSSGRGAAPSVYKS